MREGPDGEPSLRDLLLLLFPPSSVTALLYAMLCFTAKRISSLVLITSGSFLWSSSDRSLSSVCRQLTMKEGLPSSHRTICIASSSCSSCSSWSVLGIFAFSIAGMNSLY